MVANWKQGNQKNRLGRLILISMSNLFILRSAARISSFALSIRFLHTLISVNLFILSFFWYDFVNQMQCLKNSRKLYIYCCIFYRTDRYTHELTIIFLKVYTLLIKSKKYFLCVCKEWFIRITCDNTNQRYYWKHYKAQICFRFNFLEKPFENQK